MTPESVTRSTWPNIGQRIAVLDHEILQWSSIISEYKGELEDGKERHAKYVLETSRAELNELLGLLSFWEEHRANGKKEISLTTFLAIAISYGVAIVIILIYLALLVGR